MNSTNTTESALRPRLAWVRAVGIFGALFGLLTIKEGGAVLFVDGAGRAAAGNFVPFVLWFNFLAGFVYVVAGIGLWFRQAWAARVALAIAFATIGVAAAFGVQVISGGAYEMRTVVAMALRTTVWCAIATLSWRGFRRQETK